MMVIEERKRIRNAEDKDEDQPDQNKRPEQPLNFKKKSKGK